MLAATAPMVVRPHKKLIRVISTMSTTGMARNIPPYLECQPLAWQVKPPTWNESCYINFPLTTLGVGALLPTRDFWWLILINDVSRRSRYTAMKSQMILRHGSSLRCRRRAFAQSAPVTDRSLAACPVVGLLLVHSVTLDVRSHRCCLRCCHHRGQDDCAGGPSQ
jgi:hypothetical protein